MQEGRQDWNILILHLRACCLYGSLARSFSSCEPHPALLWLVKAG